MAKAARPAGQSEGKVISLKDHAAFKKARGLAGQERRITGRDECRKALSLYGEISPGFASMLGLPEKLYRHGGPDGASFSSDADGGIDDFANRLLQMMDIQLPPRIPDYGITVTSMGGTIFAVLIDKPRKIIVAESLRGMQDAEGSWDLFESALRRALGYASTLESRGEEFRFVLEGDRTSIIG